MPVLEFKVIILKAGSNFKEICHKSYTVKKERITPKAMFELILILEDNTTIPQSP